jgi:hypothetical protein
MAEIKLTGKARERELNAMAEIAVKQFGISKEQARKRVDALFEQPFMKEIPDTGPEDELHAWFIMVKTEQFMKKQID